MKYRNWNKTTTHLQRMKEEENKTTCDDCNRKTCHGKNEEDKIIFTSIVKMVVSHLMKWE